VTAGSREPAIQAWQSLDPGIRREVWRLARKLRGHPDPAVAAVAARYARAALARVTRGHVGLIVFAVLTLAVCIPAVIELGSVPAGRIASTPVLALAVVAAVVVMVLVALLLVRARRSFRVRLLIRMEAANWLALPPPAARTVIASPEPPSTDHHQAVRITYGMARVWVLIARALLAALGVLAGVFGALILSGPLRVLLLVLIAIPLLVVLVAIGLAVYLVIRWVLPRRPVITMDRDGIHFTAVSHTLSWPELTEIRFFPVRPSQPRKPGRAVPPGRIYLAFVPPHPAELLIALRISRFRLLNCERCLRVFGTPIVIADRLLDHSADEIAAAAARYAPVPLRRYDLACRLTCLGRGLAQPVWSADLDRTPL
jgi:hypothetical protein